MENKLITLSVFAIILSIISIVFSYNIDKNNLGRQEDLVWKTSQGKDGEVNVYLSGPSATKVVGSDLNIFLDSSRITVTSMESGGFFSKPVIIMHDNKTLSYSLIQSPEDKTENDLSKPMFKFRLSPTNLKGFDFYILPKSQVYLRNIGGAFPRASQIILK